MPRLALALVAVLALAAVPSSAGAAVHRTRSVLYVGNNWDGTADVVQPRRFRRIARINIIPDIDERMKEIQSDPERYGYFLGIRQAVGEGHDQFVDDMFSSHNGRVLYVSRPSLADVVAIRLRDRSIIWRTKVDGNRADHMAISPDGTRLLVSASTAKVVDVIDTERPDRGAHTERRPAAREQLLARRQAGLPREHRHRVHAHGRAGPRFHEGRARVRDHRRQHLAGAAQDRHGPEARRVR